MWGRIEREIRLLPQVLVCSFTQDGDVAVLVEPSADAWAVDRAVRAILARAGSPGGVRIVGGAGLASVSIFPTPSVSRPVLVGALGATAMLAASSLVGGLALVSEPTEGVARPGPVFARAPETFDAGLEAVRSLVRLPSADGEAETKGIVLVAAGLSGSGSASGPVGSSSGVDPLGTIGLPEDFTSAGSGDVQGGSDARRGKSRTGIAAAGGVSGVAAGEGECNGPSDRGAPRARRGRHEGKGPRSWSRSVLVDPQACDSHGKGN